MTESEGFINFPEVSGHVDIDSTPYNNDDGGEDSETYFNLPSSLEELKTKLLRGYSTPAECPDTISAPKELTSSEMLSLKHYIAWKKSNGTVLAYRLHAQILQSATDVEILTLHSVKKLAATLADFEPEKVDMCPKSCIAYTGEFEDMEFCPYVRAGKQCGEPRYQTKRRPNA